MLKLSDNRAAGLGKATDLSLHQTSSCDVLKSLEEHSLLQFADTAIFIGVDRHEHTDAS